MPSQRQLKWSELRVGLTVVFASITLAILIFLMTGATGLLTRKLEVRAYFDNAGGLRVGAPVRLQGVDIGNVATIRVAPDHEHKLMPVQVTMKIGRYQHDIRTDSIVTLSTAGVLGETFVDIDSTQAKGAPAPMGAVLPTREKPDLQDVVRASQSTLQNLDILVKRMDRIIAAVESGQGSIGKLIYDDTLYKRLNASVSEVQSIVASISQGKGSVGKFIMSDELYRKANASVDKLNSIIDQINEGQGTIGKLVKDPALYDNANQTIAKANQLMADINAGKGALGKFAKDEEFARKLDNTVTRLSQLTDKMESGQGTLGKLFNDPSLYNNSDHMLVEVRQLVQAIRENPKRYLTIRFRIF